jgi:hypothetical protein
MSLDFLAASDEHHQKSRFSRGDNFAVTSSVSRWYLDDRAPGLKPATVTLPGGGAIHVMCVAVPGPLIPPRIFVRVDADGQVFLAIDRTLAPAGSADT